MRRFLILAILLPGCLSAPPTSCAECDPSGLADHAPLAILDLQDCRGVQGSFDVPSDVVRDGIPSAFEPDSTVPYAASFVVEAYRCARVVGPDVVWEEPAILWVSLAALPDNGTWSSGDFSSYTLDVVATDPSLAQLLALTGLPARYGVLDVQDNDVPAGLRSHRWTFRTEPGEYRLEWVASVEKGPPARSQQRQFWAGEGPFARVDVATDEAFARPLAYASGAVEADATTRLHRLTKTDLHGFVGLPIASTEWRLTLQPTQFEADP